jgi:hypothetical protein
MTRARLAALPLYSLGECECVPAATPGQDRGDGGVDLVQAEVVLLADQEA